jgi:3-phenylpropionate/cinnamic acid dioxygenase small subunit
VTDADLREIKDRAEIEKLMFLYAEMVDQRDWALMDRIFALEATVDYTTSGGIKGPFREVLAWLDRALEAWPINLHQISNLIVEFEGENEARSRCYFNSPMGRKNPDGSQLIITNAGSYKDRLVRTNDGWRIVERYCNQTVMEGSLPEGYEIPS